MKTTLFFVFALCAMLVSVAFAECQAYPCSLYCRMIDWVDAPGTTMRFGQEFVGTYYTYNYSGTYLWDLAMGESVLVWLPGTDRIMFVDPFNSTTVDTTASFEFGPVNAVGAAIDDSVIYIHGGGGALGFIYDVDSLRLKDGVGAAGADFYYAVIQDTFLYTTSPGLGEFGLQCINVANPESIFIVYNAPAFFGECGMEIIDDYAYIVGIYEEFLDTAGGSPGGAHVRPYWLISIAKILGDTAAVGESLLFVNNVGHGDIASDGDYLFYVNTELSDYIYGTIDYTLGSTHLGVWGYDYSYTWTEPDSEGSFGIDVISDILLAVGFEHGLSILNYGNLDSIYEVAYYRDDDTQFCFTQFELKDYRLYAVAHPRDNVCRLYMFELDEDVINGQAELTPKPDKFELRTFPNPFNSSCKFAFSGINEPIKNIEIYDINGRIVDRLPVGAHLCVRPNEEQTHGSAPTEIVWQPDKLLPSGLYFARIKTNNYSVTAKLVYLA